MVIVETAVVDAVGEAPEEVVAEAVSRRGEVSEVRRLAVHPLAVSLREVVVVDVEEGEVDGVAGVKLRLYNGKGKWGKISC